MVGHCAPPSNIKYTPVAKRSLNEYDDDDYCSWLCQLIANN